MKRIVFAWQSCVLGAALAASACGETPAHRSQTQASEARRTFEVRVVAINDFHGNLEEKFTGTVPVPAGAPVKAGGARYLATHVASLLAEKERSIFVAAGDLIGASPLTSGLFHDEPTIEVMNQMGLALSSVGNHEFDEGLAELERMQMGGCHPIDGCQDGDGFAGAAFSYLSANVFLDPPPAPEPGDDDDDASLTFFRGYRIKKFAPGVKIAFVGMVLEGTPTIVMPDAIRGVRFADEADTVNALVPELQEHGVDAIVVLLHQGGFQTGFYDQCTGFGGDVVDIVKRLDPAITAVVSGHTHVAYNCLVQRADGTTMPVTQALNNGKVVTTLDLTIERGGDDGHGRVTAIDARNHVVTQDVPPDPAVGAIVDKYVALARPLADRVIGRITATMPKPQRTIPDETSLGDAIADAQLESTAPANRGGAQVAFMNPGGVRADLTYPQSGTEGDGNVTYGEAFNVQPFANGLVTMTLTGAQLATLLEQQYQGTTTTRMLQPSAGVSYTWRQTPPAGEPRAVDIRISGVALAPTASYRVTVNSFLAAGGDGFAVLKNGTDRVPGEIDLDAFVEYLQAHSPLSPPAPRITRLP